MTPSLRCSSAIIPSLSSSHQLVRAAQTRSFSATRQDFARQSIARRQFFRWIQKQGQRVRDPLEGGETNYLGAYDIDGNLVRVEQARHYKKLEDEKQEVALLEQGLEYRKPKVYDEDGREILEEIETPPQTEDDLVPFTTNPHFISQAVLSEELREAIWRKVMIDGESVREVSSHFGVDMTRVGAVVRLKEVEKEWRRIGKPLAKPYAEAVMTMLPRTAYERDPKKIVPHESIHDLPVHRATDVQIFHPTSESRHFTRADAAKVFDEKLLPADDRVPHPELALMHKDLLQGMTEEEVAARQQERDALQAEKKEQFLERKKKRDSKTKTVSNARWQFKITDVNVENAGRDGRGPKGVGWRYGQPFMDRMRGQIKIPTRVE